MYAILRHLSWLFRRESRDSNSLTNCGISPFDALSNDEVLELISTIGPHNQLGTPYIGYKPLVFRVTDDTVVKCEGVNVCEAFTMEFVASRTSILVPKFRRLVSADHNNFIFMEYIDGEDLDILWPSLSIWAKLRVIWTIRGYIRQLQRVKLPHPNIPGPINEAGRAEKCVGHTFSFRGGGPFASHDELTAYFDSHTSYREQVYQAQSERGGYEYKPCNLSFDNTLPLVLTHGDICPHNIRMDTRGRIWLLDWGFSGAYPMSFEYNGMICHSSTVTLMPFLWKKMVGFMAGTYTKQRQYILTIAPFFDELLL